MRTAGRIVLGLLLLVPYPVLCGAQKALSTPPVVHHFSPRTTLIEQGDTLTWISAHSRQFTATSPRDTSVFVFHHDSSVTQIRPGGQKLITPRYARILRNLLALAKQQEDVEKKLGTSLHN